MKDYDSSFLHLVGPQKLARSLNVLRGILEGIAIDSKINNLELEALKKWMSEYGGFADKHPFNELIPTMREALKDGEIDDEERLDIIWLCNRLSEHEDFYDIVTADMQTVQGIIGGISADGTITVEELENLSKWIDENAHLKNNWPYDEIEAVILAVLEDGKIDSKEYTMLLHFFDEISSFAKYRKTNPKQEKQRMAISGVCSVCPEIDIKKSIFCITGKSNRMVRREIADMIEERGGSFTNQIAKYVDYLIVCSGGNNAWAFSCYGRKIEAAMNWRKEAFLARNLGRQKPKEIVLVHENDFWDAIEDTEIISLKPRMG